MDSASYQMKGNCNKETVYLTLEIFRYIFNSIRPPQMAYHHMRRSAISAGSPEITWKAGELRGNIRDIGDLTSHTSIEKYHLYRPRLINLKISENIINPIDSDAT